MSAMDRWGGRSGVAWRAPPGGWLGARCVGRLVGGTQAEGMLVGSVHGIPSVAIFVETRVYRPIVQSRVSGQWPLFATFRHPTFLRKNCTSLAFNLLRDRSSIARDDSLSTEACGTDVDPPVLVGAGPTNGSAFATARGSPSSCYGAAEYPHITPFGWPRRCHRAIKIGESSL